MALLSPPAVWAQQGGEAQAIQYAGTVSGVQAALDACETAGGGTVLIDSDAAIPIVATSIKIPNRVRLLGTGDHSAGYTFVATATTSVTAMIENKNQDGTQQYAYVEHISINCNKALGATVGAGILYKSVYAGSRIKDVLIVNASGNGLKLDGGTTEGLGQMMLDNVTVTGCSDDNILITGPCDGVMGYQITSESVVAGKALAKITLGASAGSATFGHYFFGVHFEGTTACDGFILDRCSGCLINGISYDGSASALNLVKITGTGTGSDGAFGASGNTVRNAFANLTTIIDDVTAGVTVGNAQSRFVEQYSSPSVAAGAVNHQLVGIQRQQQGLDIASASALILGNGNLFTITGTADITSISTAARDKGRIVVLTFSGTAATSGVVDGSNLKLNGNFVYTPDDSLTLISNGTNWIEMARSTN